MGTLGTDPSKLLILAPEYGGHLEADYKNQERDYGRLLLKDVMSSFENDFSSYADEDIAKRVSDDTEVWDEWDTQVVVPLMETIPNSLTCRSSTYNGEYFDLLVNVPIANKSRTTTIPIMLSLGVDAEYSQIAEVIARGDNLIRRAREGGYFNRAESKAARSLLGKNVIFNTGIKSLIFENRYVTGVDDKKLEELYFPKRLGLMYRLGITAVEFVLGKPGNEEKLYDKFIAFEKRYDNYSDLVKGVVKDPDAYQYKKEVVLEKYWEKLYGILTNEYEPNIPKLEMIASGQYSRKKIVDKVVNNRRKNEDYNSTEIANDKARKVLELVTSSTAFQELITK